MKGINSWSYRPYRPLLTDVGDIYICRVAPHENDIHFEWLAEENTTYSVYYRKRGEGEFIHFADTEGDCCDITDLPTETEYEFYVSSGIKKSRVRLAKCIRPVGTVVNYLHPEDDVYSFSGHYLCSPSLVRHPDGYLLASMDVFAGEHPQNLSLIFRSDDDGETWHYVSELMPCFWGQLVIHKGELYMISCSTEYGDLQIGKSTDGGKTFTPPVVLLRGSNAKNGNAGVHKNPQNIVYRDGRLYTSVEWGTWKNKDYCHAAMVMSCDADADLMVSENWHFTEPKRFEAFTPELEGMPSATMTIEGTVVEAPDGKLLNVMRFGRYNTALVYEINTEDPDAPLTFSHLMEFPANYSKFMIRFDEVSKYYYCVGTRVYDKEKVKARNLLSLLRSPDLEKWEVVTDILDSRDKSENEVGYQYPDFMIEGDDIKFLCRTAWGGAHNYHDANYSTFHVIKNFRDL